MNSRTRPVKFVVMMPALLIFVSAWTVDVFTEQNLKDAVRSSSKYKGKPVSIDVKDIEIPELIKILAEIGDLDVIIDDDVTGRTSLKVKKVPWDQVLELILKRHDLTKERRGDLLSIKKAEL